jgi:electron transport complex protein RnfD
VSNRKLYIASSPHVFDGDSVNRIMWTVSAALAPAAAWGVYVFGLPALMVILWCVASAAIFEALAQKLKGAEVSLEDGSAVLTGLLLAMNMPASSPWWLCVFGGAAAILLGKQVFGGLGHNPFNPALVARVLMLISFPVEMTNWKVTSGALADAVSGATPLGQAKTFLATPELGSMPQIDMMNLLMGFRQGCLGEGAIILLLLGAALLIWRGIVTWDIPVGFIASLSLITGIVYLVSPDNHLSPLTHLVTGGVVLGAFFMATDMVTSPLNAKGRWVFGLGCGLITAVIRLWGGYPEGVSFSILLMNAAVPLIDRYTKPRKFGYVAPSTAKEGAQ